MKGLEINYYNRIIDALRGNRQIMAERFLPTEDPVMESVLQWTVERDAKGVNDVFVAGDRMVVHFFG